LQLPLFATLARALLLLHLYDSLSAYRRLEHSTTFWSRPTQAQEQRRNPRNASSPPRRLSPRLRRRLQSKYLTANLSTLFSHAILQPSIPEHKPTRIRVPLPRVSAAGYPYKHRKDAPPETRLRLRQRDETVQQTETITPWLQYRDKPTAMAAQYGPRSRSKRQHTKTYFSSFPT
jgi:hypothetical protein